MTKTWQKLEKKKENRYGLHIDNRIQYNYMSKQKLKIIKKLCKKKNTEAHAK